MTQGTEIITIERYRQIHEEGFGNARDDQYSHGELTSAAVSYAVQPGQRHHPIPRIWPWSLDWWKPTPDNRIKELAKAGALIAAEIDRLLRLEGAARQSKL